MIKLKLIITILLISAISFNFTIAQKKNKEKFSKTPEEIAEKILERMKTNLELSDAQYNSIYPIVLTHAQDMKKMHEENNSYQKEDFRKQRKEKREKLQNEISVYLTDEQKQKMEEHKKQKMDKPDKRKNKGHKKHHKGFDKNKSPEEMSQKISERMKNKLNLTDEQQTSLQKIFLDHFTEVKNFKDSKDKYTNEECQKMRTERKDNLKNDVKLILTDEQFKTWEEMKMNRDNKHKKGKRKTRSK